MRNTHTDTYTHLKTENICSIFNLEIITENIGQLTPSVSFSFFRDYFRPSDSIQGISSWNQLLNNSVKNKDNKELLLSSASFPCLVYHCTPITRHQTLMLSASLCSLISSHPCHLIISLANVTSFPFIIATISIYTRAKETALQMSLHFTSLLEDLSSLLYSKVFHYSHLAVKHLWSQVRPYFT